MTRTHRTAGAAAALDGVRTAIVECERCPRLRDYCRDVARTRRAAFRDQVYWGRPVPGFGDPSARILVLGLAPAAHGGNRTGRVFTGDGRGGSGDFLFAALHRAGLANQPIADTADDGLALHDTYIAAAVRCAPPANKPLPSEVDACLPHLDAELAALPEVRVVVALGGIAWDAWLRLVARHGPVQTPRPVFAHGALAYPGIVGGRPLPLLGCYHPSRQNTHTGRVTAAMYDVVFSRAVALAEENG